jgi:hypothetical protein
MNKAVRYVIAGAAIAAGVTVGHVGAASAAHCVEGDSPGFSYFGRDHVAEDEAHGGSPEGGNPGPHAGTSGASNCRETTGSPSERAPGRR